MRIEISRFASTLLSRFMNSGADLSGHAEASSTGIRDAMLRVLLDEKVQSEAGFESVWSAVVRAPDIDSLWYLRSDVLALLARRVGEHAAWRKLDEITEMFRGLVSDSQLPVQRRQRS